MNLRNAKDNGKAGEGTRTLDLLHGKQKPPLGGPSPTVPHTHDNPHRHGDHARTLTAGVGAPTGTVDDHVAAERRHDTGRVRHLQRSIERTHIRRAVGW